MDQLHLSCATISLSELTCVQLTMTSSFRDWTGLPPELFDLILTKFGRLSEYIRFCGVCAQWRKVALESDTVHKHNLVLFKLTRKKLPMLMIRTQEHSNDFRGLYSVSDGITHNMKLPQPCKHRLFGSSHGWLMHFEENQTITLMNPLNDSCISLPKFERYKHGRNNPGYYFVKGILSADPLVSPNNYSVAVVYDQGSCNLAVYKSGDTQWKFITSPSLTYMFIDIAFHKGNLYGVDLYSSFVQIDTSDGSVNKVINIDDYADANYLVESQGDLLLVQRFWSVPEEYKDEEFDISKYSTTDFKVFKFANGKDSANWVQIFNIGERALFVGGNHSVSVSTIEFHGCLSNSIYFTSQLYMVFAYECCGRDEDSGVFKLQDKSFHSHHIMDNFEWYVEPSLWFVPNPDLDTSV